MGRILLVDDDALVRRVVRRYLERAGHQVAEAKDGIDALEVFDTDCPHLVLTDILMPRMNGLEMMVEMRRRRPGIPMIAMTGGSSADDADCTLLLARDLGAVRTFRKPLDMTGLLTAVDELALAADA